MNTLDCLTTRRSVRAYKPDAVPAELIDKMLEAGTFAPTGMGSQSPIIVAITNKEVRDQLSKLNASIMGADTDPFYGAPVVLVVLARKDVPTHVYDGSLVMGNLLNAAHELGLASCWIHRAKEEFETEEGAAILAGLGIDASEYEGIGNCIVGYADGPEPEPKPRKEDYVYRIA
ncbi:nitroreductase [Collinsella tanakaei]|uniref:nitroreductase n=1 Tax=Collinsella tanakaei TaxID=626935 RepID=UPI001957BAB5|nr:nitroreductase [Collinsella tanakaei]MBM6778851.1 nitroreductase [Collinsella tanakaei]